MFGKPRGRNRDKTTKMKYDETRNQNKFLYFVNVFTLVLARMIE
jgi:hypothetical protein